MSDQIVRYRRELRKQRKGARVSQQALAERLGLAHASTISRWENGRARFSRARFAEAIAAIERIIEQRQKATTPADVLAE